jgi:hypothetical protein
MTLHNDPVLAARELLRLDLEVDANVEMLKHLPGRHDQQRHDPYKGANATLDSILRGSDAVVRSRGPDHSGYYINPSNIEDWEVAYLEDNRTLASANAFLYDVKTRSIVLTMQSDAQHGDLIQALTDDISLRNAFADRTVHGYISKYKDGYEVRFMGRQAAVLGDATPKNEDMALRNIYTTAAKLVDLGVPANSKMTVKLESGPRIETTLKTQRGLKHLPGRHDQQRHDMIRTRVLVGSLHRMCLASVNTMTLYQVGECADFLSWMTALLCLMILSQVCLQASVSMASLGCVHYILWRDVNKILV